MISTDTGIVKKEIPDSIEAVTEVSIEVSPGVTVRVPDIYASLVGRLDLRILQSLYPDFGEQNIPALILVTWFKQLQWQAITAANQEALIAEANEDAGFSLARDKEVKKGDFYVNLARLVCKDYNLISQALYQMAQSNDPNLAGLCYSIMNESKGSGILTSTTPDVPVAYGGVELKESLERLDTDSLLRQLGFLDLATNTDEVHPRYIDNPSHISGLIDFVFNEQTGLVTAKGLCRSLSEITANSNAVESILSNLVELFRQPKLSDTKKFIVSNFLPGLDMNEAKRTIMLTVISALESQLKHLVDMMRKRRIEIYTDDLYLNAINNMIERLWLLQSQLNNTTSGAPES